MMNFSRQWQDTVQRIFGQMKSFKWSVAVQQARQRLVMQSADPRRLMRRAPTLLGWPGVTGIGLLTACAAFYFSTIQQAQQKLAATRYSAQVLQAQSGQSGQGAGANQRSREEQLAQFYQLFPQDKDLPQSMEKIFNSALSHGIGLEQGEYKVTRDKEGGLVRFQMTFPVKGDYPRIRKYLTALLADIPALSLQQVQFKRQRVGDAMVEANIKLVLFLLEQKS